MGRGERAGGLVGRESVGEKECGRECVGEREPVGERAWVTVGERTWDRVWKSASVWERECVWGESVGESMWKRECLSERGRERVWERERECWSESVGERVWENESVEENVGGRGRECGRTWGERVWERESVWENVGERERGRGRAW